MRIEDITSYLIFYIEYVSAQLNVSLNPLLPSMPLETVTQGCYAFDVSLLLVAMVTKFLPLSLSLSPPPAE